MVELSDTNAALGLAVLAVDGELEVASRAGSDADDGVQTSALAVSDRETSATELALENGDLHLGEAVEHRVLRGSITGSTTNAGGAWTENLAHDLKARAGHEEG